MRSVWFDAHLDLAYLALGGRDLTAALADATGPPQPAAVTLASLREGGVRWAFATIFTGAGFRGPGGYASGDAEGARASAIEQLDIYERLVDKGLVRIVRTRGDLELTDRPLSIVLLMEGGDPIRDAGDAAWWHERGVRIVGMSWASGSRFAGGNAQPGPITEAGRDLIVALDELGVVHDVSHLPDDAVVGLLELSGGRIVASHSNVRALVDGVGQRHLTDDVVRAIGARGGVIGLNLCANFIVDAPKARPTVGEAVDHVERVSELMGRRDGVGLGSDMDGGFGADRLPEGIDAPVDLVKLADELRARGWSDGDVEGFAHRNWMDLVGQCL